MASIFQHALGEKFHRLHPRLQTRFGFSSTDEIACIGAGTMDWIWHGRGFVRPFLALGALRNILVCEQGRDVPFRIENYAYRDAYGRETITFVRTFEFDMPRRWDATMIYSPARGTIVDYLGTHQHIAVDLHMSVDEHGGLLIRSGEQRVHEGPVHVRIPRTVTGVAEVRESYDDDLGRFRIDVSVHNHRFGPLFGYSGTFTATYHRRVPAPHTVRPVREQVRV